MAGLFALAAEPAAGASPASAVGGDLLHLAPMMVVAVWSLLLLMADAFAGRGQDRRFQTGLALAGLVVAGTLGLRMLGSPAYDGGVEVFFGFLVVDHFSILIDVAILAILAAVVLFAGDYARAHGFEYGEQESLAFVAAFGMMTLGHSNDLAALFLGVETMSLAVYVLVAARWNARSSPEAGLKYFLMGAFSSAILLMGIALIYGATGTTALGEVASGVTTAFTKWGAAQPYVQAIESGMPMPSASAQRDVYAKAITGMAPAALLLPGVLMVLAGLLFKVGAVPFHAWTPDVYEGAPTPITAFMAAGVKLASFAALLKLFVAVLSTYRLVNFPYGWGNAVLYVALATMLLGNLAALRQPNVKRLLAYSSIAHAGYMLLGVVAAANFYAKSHLQGAVRVNDEYAFSFDTGDLGVSAVLYYGITYAVATLGTLACLAWMSNQRREALSIHEWSGLAQRHPGMALGMTICVLSLLGMPPTAGFVGKLAIFRVALENTNVVMRAAVVVALLSAVVGAFYYLRLVVAMYFRPPPDDAPQLQLPGRGAQLVVALAAVGSIVFGVMAPRLLAHTELASTGFTHRPGRARKDRVAQLREARRAAEQRHGDLAGAEGDGEGPVESALRDAGSVSEAAPSAAKPSANQPAPGQGGTDEKRPGDDVDGAKPH